MIDFQFRLLRKNDLPLLFEWLALPHVAEWWRESRNYKIFSDKYISWINSDQVGAYLIVHDAKPIGYVQWANIASDPLRTEGYPKNTFGIDLFLADVKYLGKGYGAGVIRQFIDKIIMPMNPTKLIIDPEITNTRAIRVYEKVGFKKTKIAQTTDGTKMVTAQLMEMDCQ